MRIYTSIEALSVEDCAELLDDTVYVDVDGYIPKETQLRILTESGERLDEWYRRTYPGLDGLEYGSEPEEDDPIAVTGYGIDEMDAIDIMRASIDKANAASSMSTAGNTVKTEHAPPPPEGGGASDVNLGVPVQS